VKRSVLKKKKKRTPLKIKRTFVMVCALLLIGGMCIAIAADFNFGTSAGAFQKIPTIAQTTSAASETVLSTTLETTAETTTETTALTRSETQNEANTVKYPQKPVDRKKSNASGFHNPPDGTGKMVALTFDDGPHSKVTEGVLNVLGKYGAKATFFVLGNRAATHETTLKRAIGMGCEVESHSNIHAHLVQLSPAALAKDMMNANNSIEKYSGVRPKMLRPPYGETNKEMRAIVAMPIVLWSIDTRDWAYHDADNTKRSAARREKDMQKVVNEVRDLVRDGDIVLMHDIYSFTQEAAEIVIAKLAEQHWQMVTVSELFEAKGITLENGKIYRGAWVE
jgi:peptidoglycan/xylan/chitin deacetylase (PgdA/CDA1 family)